MDFFFFFHGAGGHKKKRGELSVFDIKKLARVGRGEGERFLHPLVDVDEIVAVGAAVLHILAGVDAERDATAQEEPGGGGADNDEISDPSVDLKGHAPYLIAHVCQTRKCGRLLPKHGHCAAD